MGMTGATYEGVRGVRILVDQGGIIRRLCRLAWAADDASLYILPYGVEGRFHFGQASIPASEASSTVPFNDQETSASMPKAVAAPDGPSSEIGFMTSDSAAVPVRMFCQPSKGGYAASIIRSRIHNFCSYLEFGEQAFVHRWANAPNPFTIPAEEGGALDEHR